MHHSMKVRNCPSFRPMAHDIPLAYRRTNNMGCRECAYFGSAYCTMEVADSIEPPLNIFR